MSKAVNNNNDLIGQRLLAQGRINEDDIERACQLQESVGGRFGSALIKIGALSEDHLLNALSAQLGAVPIAAAFICASATNAACTTGSTAAR